MKNLLCILALSVSALPVWAADVYQIDPTHTFANFEWNHFGFAHHGAKFTKTSGTVTLDLAKKTGSADITIEVDSVISGVPKLDEHLQSKDFFDEDKYPTITFKSDQFKFKGKQLKSVTGDLTVHGVTKPVTLKVTQFVCKDHPMMKVPACGADATAVIKRSDFGVSNYVPAVSDEITLRIEVEAQKSEAAKK
jgi:polyisoprenoid-binding protein YceI